MKAVIQRVKKAKVTVESVVTGEIGQGLLVLLGIHVNDQLDQTVRLVNKLLNLRIFSDDEGKMNRSVVDVNGEILVVSQFTLYGDCQKGRRPSFVEAAPPDLAIPLYEKFCSEVEKGLGSVQRGRFGAMMDVELINDGPVTLIIEG